MILAVDLPQRLHLTGDLVNMADAEMVRRLYLRIAVISLAVVMAMMVVLMCMRYLNQGNAVFMRTRMRDELGLELFDPALDLRLEVRIFFLYLL